jgi:hypothetical protein
MCQRLEVWSAEDEKAWLLALIAAAEEVSRPQPRPRDFDSAMRVCLEAQLAKPASGYLHGDSVFSLRN